MPREASRPSTPFSAPPPRRFLHLWLPRLIADGAQRAEQARGRVLASPYVVVAKSANALRLTAVDAEAAKLGLQAGLSLADARARVPELTVAEADPAGDRRRLAGLAEACRRYSPALAVEPPDGVALDVTGCERLFGGEAVLAQDLLRRVVRAGYAARLAVADNPALAFALSHHGRTSPLIAPLGEAGRALLRPLPPEALRLEPEAARTLHRLGLRTLGQLEALPRAALARRLGPEALARLDEAMGRRASPLIAKLEVPPHLAELRFSDGLVTEEAVLAAVGELAAALAPRLEGEGMGARRFRLDLFRVDGAVKRLETAASAPLRDPARIRRLYAERLAGLNEGLEADFGFDQLRLTALALQPLSPAAQDLMGTRDRGADFAALADRLAARLGPKAVRRLVPVPEAQAPEAQQRLAPMDLTRRPAWTAPPLVYDGAPLRPARLFAPPQPIEVLAEVPEGPPQRFRWRRLARRVVLAEGPERIELAWWDSPLGAPLPRPRDYYRLEDEKGRKYWIFREGLYGGAEPPRWFLHGLFA